MSTRQLNPRTAGTGRLAAAQMLHALTRTPTPPFALAFPVPTGHGLKHPNYEIRLAANRVYQAHKKLYREKGLELSAPDLMLFVRRDVLKHVLEEEIVKFGPFSLARYKWLDSVRLQAWLPVHRERAEGMYEQFKAGLKRRRGS